MSDSKVNIREIAKAAGVSIASVSRALQPVPSPKISEEQRKHILELCARMQYVPNVHTRRMLSRRSGTVAILFPPIAKITTDASRMTTDANLSACMMGAQAALAEQGIDLLLTEVTETFLEEKRFLRMIRGKTVDGFLIWGALGGDDYLNELFAEKIPVVMLQTTLENAPCPSVVADDYHGMYQLTERLIASGHRRIALAVAPDSASTGRARAAGVRDAMRKHNLELAAESSEQGYGYEFGRRAAFELLNAAPEVSCIINPNDMAAWGCIDACKERGAAVPERISIVGADGLHFPGEVRITSYFSPSYQIGQTGARLLLEEIGGGAPARSTVLSVTPVPGNTIRELA